MTLNVGTTVAYVSEQLNDQGINPYVRWPQQVLLDYLNNALIQIGTFRPDAYTSSVTLTLAAGAQQTLPANYSFLKSLDYNASSSNCPGAPITEANLDILRAFFKKPCSPSGGAADYRVTSYAYDMRNPHIFYVSPPVSDDAIGLQVTGTAVSPAPQYVFSDIAANTVIAIDPKYANTINAWMEFEAYSIDTESTSSRQTKLDALGLFYKSLGIEYKQESLYRSGYFLGQRGQGDPRSSAH